MPDSVVVVAGQRLHGLARQAVSFFLVGGIGLVIDVVVFNALRTTVLSPHDVHGGPIIAKTISTALAIVANWIGNRYWTFRAERRRGSRAQVVREAVEFGAVSIAGSLIALGCLWISHYALGYTSLLADNVASNVVGLALGTAFRFALYRWWVFGVRRIVLPPAPAEAQLGATRAGVGGN
ncbi:GtrA family protein [Lacisediminihabitans changchengi]|uniref:GtrA family protein n=1 Tax=Lacisediminihabitans changchengi TaxID=2787634 RepID=A0A934SMB4_9MICO|nr:GtrA family protein [Lacisediminihabitans changchengi]MBK4346898.1 GtrA family protein [Lacisediminihabitans changchengi]MBK4347979.1 GtrA family protein [Lacisediminihabitans changchengi]